RIATDLHDDVGSSLSQIAVLSEVAQQRSGRVAEESTQLSHIAHLSREATSSIGDIVWAIYPQRDSLGDLIARMRRFAADVFTAKEISFSLAAPPKMSSRRLDIDLRRQLFLIFKEAVHNILRHASCTHAVIQLRFRGRFLELEIVDNGIGFSSVQDG